MPDDYWTLRDIAEFLGVRAGTVSAYRTRGEGRMPEPVRYFGRSPVWDAAAIREWAASRKPATGRQKGPQRRKPADRD